MIHYIVKGCEIISLRTKEDLAVLRKTIWSNESQFTRESIFNIQNSHFGASKKSHYSRKTFSKPIYSKLNLFALIMNDQARYYIYEEALNRKRPEIV